MKRTCVLALGGLDPGGGAGILADARAIERAGAFPCAVATVLTVQSTRGLRRVAVVDSKLWTEQARVVLAEQRVRAIKVGALGDATNVRALVKLLAWRPRIPVVFDPVMVSTSGKRLLDARAVSVLEREIVPRVALVTANIAEAEALTGLRITTYVEAHRAANALVEMGARAALVKGGHLVGPRAVDFLATRAGRTEMFSRRRVQTRRPLHGAGCTLASLIAARLALGDEIMAAVRFAKRVHHAAIIAAVDVGGSLDVLTP